MIVLVPPDAIEGQGVRSRVTSNTESPFLIQIGQARGDRALREVSLPRK